MERDRILDVTEECRPRLRRLRLGPGLNKILDVSRIETCLSGDVCRRLAGIEGGLHNLEPLGVARRLRLSHHGLPFRTIMSLSPETSRKTSLISGRASTKRRISWSKRSRSATGPLTTVPRFKLSENGLLSCSIVLPILHKPIRGAALWTTIQFWPQVEFSAADPALDKLRLMPHQACDHQDHRNLTRP